MSDDSIKRLYRSDSDRVIAGVCGGLGDYFKVDPIWMRIIFIVLLFGGGFSLLLYVLMWLIVPLAPKKTD